MDELIEGGVLCKRCGVFLEDGEYGKARACLDCEGDARREERMYTFQRRLRKLTGLRMRRYFVDER